RRRSHSLGGAFGGLRSRLLPAALSERGAQPPFEVGRQRGRRQPPRQRDRDPVRFHERDAGRTAPEGLADLLAAVRRQVVLEEAEQQLHHLATGDHAGTSSKWWARACRISSRARCRRLLTAGTLSPSRSAISGLFSPSTSASTYTSRYVSGRRAMASSTS